MMEFVLAFCVIGFFMCLGADILWALIKFVAWCALAIFVYGFMT